MPVTVEIDGLGKVELDDSFKSKSAAEQEQIISDIVAQAHPQSHGGGGGGAPRDRSAPETYRVLERIVKQLYPHAVITSDKRTPEHNAEVGGVPDSYHVSGQGIDIDGLSAAERSDLKSQMEGMGIKFDEFLYHKVAKGGGLHLHMASTHVPDELFGDAPAQEAPPEGQDAPPADAPPAPGDPSGPPPADLPPKGPEESWGHAIASSAGDLVKGVGEGFTDFQNDATGLLLRGTDAIGLTEGSHDRFDKAREHYGDPNDAAGYNHPDGWSRTIGNVGGNLIAGAPLMELKPLEAVAGKTKAVGSALQKLKTMGRYEDYMLQGAVGGAITSGGNDIAKNMAVGAALAPALGAAGDLAGAVTPEARAVRFANKEAKLNPEAAMDAEIVQDLIKARDTLNRSPTDPKARAPLDVKAINSVANSYTVQMKTLIGKLDLPEMEKIKLRSAIEQKHSLAQEEIDALRGTTAGDAVADAIVKTQRLKRLTPEIARDPSWVTRAGKLLATGSDLLPIPGVVGRGIRYVTKAASGDAEAARVHAAQALLNKQRGYAKLQEMVGPSGQRESRQALWDEAEQAIGEKEAAGNVVDPVTLAKAKERAWSAKQKMDGTAPPKPSTAQNQANTAWSQREKAMTAAEKLKAQQEEAMWANKPAAPDDPVPVDRRDLNKELGEWDAELKAADARYRAKLKMNAPKPEKPVKPEKPKPLGDQLIEKGIEQGLPGVTKTRQAFKDRLGIQDDQTFDKVLDDFVANHPEAKPEVDRIRLSYPTKDRTFGSKATPHLKAAMDKMGIKPVEAPTPAAAAKAPAPVPVDEAAQARLADKAPEAPAVKPTEAPIDFEAAKRADEAAGFKYNEGDGTWTNTKTGETSSGLGEVEVSAPDEGPRYRRVTRPAAHAASRDRRIGMAQDSIVNMTTKVRPEILERIGNLPEHAVHNIKTGDEARAFYDNDVDMELRAAGATPQEMDAVRSTFYDIATFKPYQTQEQFDANALTSKGRGRPRKQN